MKYCKKCGAELSDGVSFCEKCGNQIGEISGQGTEEKRNGKNVLIASLVGLIVVAVGTVGLLFATGVLGGKESKETVAVKENNSGESQDSKESQNSEQTEQEEISSETEQTSETEQAMKSSKSKQADLAWTAYSAYVGKILPAINSYKQYLQEMEDNYDEDDYYEEEEWDGSDYDFPADRCSDYFALFYMDSDDYPELLCGTKNPVLLTYKNGKVIFAYYDGKGLAERYAADMSLPTGDPYGGPYISYRERKNSLHVYTDYVGALQIRDAFYSLDEEGGLKTDWFGDADGSSFRGENDPEKWRIVYTIASNGSTQEVTEKEYNKQLAQRKGNDNTWRVLKNADEEESAGGETIFEAWYDFANRDHLFSN